MKLRLIIQKRVLEIVLAELLVFTALGVRFHNAFTSLKTTLPAAMFLMLLQPMFSIDFSSIRKRGLRQHARFTLLVLVLYLAVAPALTLLLVHVWDNVMPDWTSPLLLGAVTVELSPVAMPAPAFTALCGGDVELSLLSVVVTFILAPVTMPAYIVAILHRVASVPVGQIARSIALYILAPLAVGQTLRTIVTRHASTPVEAAETLAEVNARLALVSCLALYWLVAVVFGTAAPVLTRHISTAGGVVALLLVFTVARFLAAKALARLSGLPRRAEIALVFAASANGALGTAIALSAFGPEAGAGAVLAGPVAMLLAMTVVLRLYQHGGNRG